MRCQNLDVVAGNRLPGRLCVLHCLQAAIGWLFPAIRVTWNANFPLES